MPFVYHILVVAGVTLIGGSFVKGQIFIRTALSNLLFIIDRRYFLRMISIVLVLGWVLYRYSWPYVYSRFLSGIHVGLTLLLVFVLGYLLWKAARLARRGTAPSMKTFAEFRTLNRSLFLVVIGFATTQLLLLVNLALGLYFLRN